MKLHALAAALALAAFLPFVGAAPAPIEDTVEVAVGAFFQETIYPPSDGSAWSVRAEAINGTGPFDLYIMPTTELLNAYPDGNFAPMVARDNVNLTFADFRAPSRLQGFTLIIDNRDNPRSSDAVPRGNLTVVLLRTPPLRSNPEAQAALSAGTTVCTAILGASTVAVAIYLKRRRAADTGEGTSSDRPRVEIDIEVPPPPRGAWARIAPDDEVGEDPPKEAPH